jgi:hypothetical protein
MSIITKSVFVFVCICVMLPSEERGLLWIYSSSKDLAMVKIVQLSLCLIN